VFAGCVFLVGACSSHGTSAAPKSTTAPARPVPAVCGPFARLSALDRSTTVARNLLANDWHVLRTVVVMANDTNQEIYPAIAAATSGTTRSDARLVAAFMPRSRTIALRSTSLPAYLSGIHGLPGDAATQAAATRVFADLARTCRGLTTPPATAPPAPATVVLHVNDTSGRHERAHVFYNDPAGIPVVLDVTTPWESPRILYPRTGELRLVATTPTRGDSNLECRIAATGGSFSGGSAFGSTSCGIGVDPQRRNRDDAIGPPIG
jgi:hypothetical protein